MTAPAKDETTVIGSESATNLKNSLIRTFVPLLVGTVGTILLKLGIHITGDLTPVITAGLSYVYYFLVRVFEHVGSSKWGWLLGKAAAPVYQTGSQTDLKP